MDVENQLNLISKTSSYLWLGLVAIIVGTIWIAIYKKRKGGNYRLVIILGVGVLFFYLLIMAFVMSYLVSPVYNLGG
ncbi:hypothetical protein A2714_04245 [Candidatus Woesebacteria bacterium RIFCSPHIGHO2_01_FULL_38_9]|uniref:Uncharacterized protein n=2 Tax=Candidatus Woeseibacteriota TaxID=1752722 RepID=A0A1F7XZT0_9BACT|nr:MAG: hypothetical protein A2714_04245 [Candidatus Woesebacteria bacterium RIFCSPHIGHO2_01_FULL_38_9]OGM58974.1 MAG: hypothetical protein A3A75_00480 [Candidatus Woesebacteria bacterium RIFCSPLOWO2_01_FULL_39_10]